MTKYNESDELLQFRFLQVKRLSKQIFRVLRLLKLIRPRAALMVTAQSQLQSRLHLHLHLHLYTKVLYFYLLLGRIRTELSTYLTPLHPYTSQAGVL